MSNKITDYLLEVQKIIDSISKEDISNAIQILNEARLAGKKIFIVGNGGSASTATHFACDLNKYTSVEGEKRFRALSLEDNIPLFYLSVEAFVVSNIAQLIVQYIDRAHPPQD